MSPSRHPTHPGDPATASLSIVVPCYDEHEVIPAFHRELAAVLATLDVPDVEIVFVDDGSEDDTLAKLNELAGRDPRVRVCSLARNFGHQVALTAGLDFATGDAVIMMDCDLQHPPALIPEMVAKWREGFEIVSAVRIDTRGVSLAKKLCSRAFYAVINALSDTEIPPGAADFCLVSRRVCDVLGSMRERHRFLRGMISWTGFRRAFIDYEAGERAAGRSKYTPVKMFTMALDAAFSFSTAPIRLATRVGLVITAAGFAYLVWNLVKAFWIGTAVAGWASILGLTMVLGGSQLVFIGIVGQYLARVFEESKGRPLYVLNQAPVAASRTEPVRPETDALAPVPRVQAVRDAAGRDR